MRRASAIGFSLVLGMVGGGCQPPHAHTGRNSAARNDVSSTSADPAQRGGRSPSPRPAPPPPPAAPELRPAPASKIPLKEGSACVEFRPDNLKARVALLVFGGSPESRLLLRLLLEKKAREVGIPNIEPSLERSSCGAALVCAWTESDSAQKLATVWAQTLNDPTPSDFYGIRADAIQTGLSLDESSLEWRLLSTLSALQRSPQPDISPPALERLAGGHFIKSVLATQFEAEMRRLVGTAELWISLPEPPQRMVSILAGLGGAPTPSRAAAPPRGPSSTGGGSTVVLEDKDGPDPGLAVVGWGDVALSSNEAALIELGLEVVRTRFNRTHGKSTEIHARLSTEQPFATPRQLLLSGPAQNLPSAIDLLKEELDRSISASGPPTSQELGRALLNLRDSRSSPTPSACDPTPLDASAEDVAQAVRKLREPRAVLWTASGPSTEAE